MGRTDSAFDAPYNSSIRELKSSPTYRSHTAPAPPRFRISRRDSPKATDNTRRSHIATTKQGSKDDSSSPSKPGSPSRKSLASSSEGSAQSRPRCGHGSKHSSHRTSFTIVDTSRPARHYRFNSSNSVISANRDIDDPLALHFRSCTLFKDAGTNLQVHALQPGSHQDQDQIQNHARRPPNALASPQNDDANHARHTALHEELPSPSPPPVTKNTTVTTTTHWLSPESRKAQYEKIDKANTGIRCLMRKVTPRFISGPPPSKFYEKNTSDTGSVRRYRMDIHYADEEGESGQEDVTAVVSHKADASQRGPLIPAPPPQPNLTTRTSKRTKKGTKRWKLCFLF